MALELRRITPWCGPRRSQTVDGSTDRDGSTPTASSLSSRELARVEGAKSSSHLGRGGEGDMWVWSFFFGVLSLVRLPLDLF